MPERSSNGPSIEADDVYRSYDDMTGRPTAGQLQQYLDTGSAGPRAYGENLTVLETSLLEGVAEFVAELISRGVAYPHLPAMVSRREKEIGAASLQERSKRDLFAWIGNGTANLWSRIRLFAH